MLAEVSSGRKNLADMENEVDKIKSDLAGIREDNEFREKEN